LIEPTDHIEAAEVTGWQSHDSISIGRCRDTSSLAVAAKTVLRKNVGREFPIRLLAIKVRSIRLAGTAWQIKALKATTMATAPLTEPIY
jgi:hypothetical protein